MDRITIYATGLVYTSVCVAKDVPLEEIEDTVNALHPIGIESRWAASKDKTFADKTTPNPCTCEQDENRMHYLLSC